MFTEVFTFLLYVVVGLITWGVLTFLVTFSRMMYLTRYINLDWASVFVRDIRIGEEIAKGMLQQNRLYHLCVERTLEGLWKQGVILEAEHLEEVDLINEAQGRCCMRYKSGKVAEYRIAFYTIRPEFLKYFDQKNRRFCLEHKKAMRRFMQCLFFIFGPMQK